MKILILLIISVFLFGCSDESPDIEDCNGIQAETVHNPPTDEREAMYEKWSKEIGGQFWPFSVKEYAFQEDEFDVVSGLGGRWITARYLLREGHHITREEMAQRISQSFEFYEWTLTDLPDEKLIPSTIYETAENDLYFTRRPFSSDDVVNFYNITIHISDDAGVLVLYCEAGW